MARSLLDDSDVLRISAKEIDVLMNPEGVGNERLKKTLLDQIAKAALSKTDALLRACCIIMLFVILVPVYGQESAYPPSWNSLQNHEIPAWFKDAKFGIYTHWGVYSVPAKGPNGTWYPHIMYCKGTEQYNYHVEHYGLPSQFGYKDFMPMFKADKFNAGGQVSIVSPKRQTVGILHIYPESSECRDAEQELY